MDLNLIIENTCISHVNGGSRLTEAVEKAVNENKVEVLSEAFTTAILENADNAKGRIKEKFKNIWVAIKKFFMTLSVKFKNMIVQFKSNINKDLEYVRKNEVLIPRNASYTGVKYVNFKSAFNLRGFDKELVNYIISLINTDNPTKEYFNEQIDKNIKENVTNRFPTAKINDPSSYVKDVKSSIIKTGENMKCDIFELFTDAASHVDMISNAIEFTTKEVSRAESEITSKLDKIDSDVITIDDVMYAYKKMQVANFNSLKLAFDISVECYKSAYSAIKVVLKSKTK